MSGAADIIIRREGRAGRITLNRPRALNALTVEMVRAIDAALADWAADDAVRLVLIDGAGERGLCAGGDIRTLYDAVLAGDETLPREFFRAEYRMNAHIAAFPKPYVAFMDGIVMGGGVGVSAHGSVRVVTERTRLAMPETSIGFITEVGGTWLLGRAADGMGVHAAMTSEQMPAADAILCGFADHCVAAADLAALADALTGCDGMAAVRAAVARYAITPPAGNFAASRHWMRSCYALKDAEAILAALRGHEDERARAAAAAMEGKSPTSLKVTLRAIREAPRLGSLNACLEREFRLALHFMGCADFREGVRAAVVDKDRMPRWQPPDLAQVDAALVDAFFDAPDHGGLGLER